MDIKVDELFVVFAEEGMFDSRFEYDIVFVGRKNAEKFFNEFISGEPRDEYGCITVCHAFIDPIDGSIRRDYEREIFHRMFNPTTMEWEERNEEDEE